METILIKIGAAVTKAILKLWLKDSAIAKAVGLGLADVLEKKGFLEQFSETQQIQ